MNITILQGLKKCLQLEAYILGQRWASTLANGSSARHRHKTRPGVGRSERSYFLKKPRLKVLPSTSTFSNVECRRSVIDLSSLYHLLKDRAFYPDLCTGRVSNCATFYLLPSLPVSKAGQNYRTSI